uniref:Uncharacterized protein n=1 Tax=Trichogramma kaykai TaxID=54128 RepID=A0ABD2W5E9_9HYME
MYAQRQMQYAPKHERERRIQLIDRRSDTSSRSRSFGPLRTTWTHLERHIAQRRATNPLQLRYIPAHNSRGAFLLLLGCDVAIGKPFRSRLHVPRSKRRNLLEHVPASNLLSDSRAESRVNLNSPELAWMRTRRSSPAPIST